jgi:hypothetical protein
MVWLVIDPLGVLEHVLIDCGVGCVARVKPCLPKPPKPWLKAIKSRLFSTQRWRYLRWRHQLAVAAGHERNDNEHEAAF